MTRIVIPLPHKGAHAEAPPKSGRTTGERPSRGSWQSEFLHRAIDGAFPMVALEALFDRMERLA